MIWRIPFMEIGSQWGRQVKKKLGNTVIEDGIIPLEPSGYFMYHQGYYSTR
jgi:hypothetical protein